MKLIHKTSPDEEGKYAVTNSATGIVLDGSIGSDDEFFVIMLKDRHSQAALMAYADSVRSSDPEYADEVTALANRAGPDSPHCKTPD